MQVNIFVTKNDFWSFFTQIFILSQKVCIFHHFKDHKQKLSGSLLQNT